MTSPASGSGTIQDTFATGRALHEAGALSQAEESYRRVLALSPDHQGALNHLGVLLFSAGRPSESAEIFAKLAAIAPAWAEAHNNLANVLAALGEHEKAIAAYERALALDPELQAARTNLAALHFNRGLALAKQAHHARAMSHFERTIALNPGQSNAHAALGFSQHALGRPEEALISFRQALAIEPDNTEALRGFGIAAQALGQMNEARHALERAIALAPANPSYHRVLSQMKRYAAGDAQIAAMERLATNASQLAGAQQAELHYALGKAHRDLGNVRVSLEHLARANAIRRSQIRYDEAATLDMLRRIAAAFSSGVMAHKQGGGDASILPIFIIGMPRSGTTLVEQILASHPLVAGGGERPHLSDIARALSSGTVPFPESLPLLEPKTLGEAGSRYVEILRAEHPGAARITDKMPTNFAFAGLIHLILPNAKIIHVSRDAIDTCVSCFTRTFGRNLPFSYDLGELGRYYRAYAGLMNHWRSVLPEGRMLEIRYEDIIGNLEGEARRMLAHCGLDWDARCVDFHHTQRAILTASAAEVREPLYASAIGRWKDCGDLLAPLIEALEATAK